VKFLVDTDHLIDHLKNHPEAGALLDRHAADGLAVSIITVAELYEGAFNSAETEHQLQITRDALIGYNILGITDRIAEIFAQQRSRLRSQGQLIPDLDLLIASTAIAHDLTLMTRNTRHFDRVAGLTLYQSEEPSDEL
jgi:tRNA(fMet)-specific endonuclease VapC